MVRGYMKPHNISWRIYDFRTRFYGRWAYQHQFCLGRFTLLPKYQTWEWDELADLLKVPHHKAYCFEWLWWCVIFKKKK